MSRLSAIGAVSSCRSSGSPVDGFLLVLVGLAHFEQRPAVGQEPLGLGGADLADLGLGLLK